MPFAGVAFSTRPWFRYIRRLNCASSTNTQFLANHQAWLLILQSFPFAARVLDLNSLQQAIFKAFQCHFTLLDQVSVQCRDGYR
jgi:hypothetical protein